MDMEAVLYRVKGIIVLDYETPYDWFIKDCTLIDEPFHACLLVFVS